MEPIIIDSSELRTMVINAVHARAMPAPAPGTAIADDTRLANLGIDSLGLVLIFVDLAARTGFPFERQEGMAPMRTVGNVIEYAMELASRAAVS